MKLTSFLVCLLIFNYSAAQVTPPSVGDSSVYKMAGLQKEPEFPGGKNAFLKEVYRHFNVPELDHDLTAKVHVSFIIEKDGSISAVECRKNPGFGLGEEAVRVVSSIKTKWKPAIQHGVPVRVSYILPISIQILGEVREEPVFSSEEVDVKPEFPGGYDAFVRTFQGCLVYPETGENPTTNKTFAVIIEKDGNVKTVVVQGERNIAANEAATAAALCAKSWSPAKKDGQPVRCVYVFSMEVTK